jgi:hypothetical protein
VRRLLFEKRQRVFSIRRFHAAEPHAFGDCHAKTANTLFVIHDQETNSQAITHDGFPMVFSTTEMNC